MSELRRIHFWVGFLGIIIFLLTGQYMYHVHDHLKGMQNETRMLFRSAHIYFLLSSLINLVLGVYLVPFQQRHRAILQYIASILLLVSPFFLLAGFFTEPHMSDLARPYSRVGLYALFGSSFVFLYLGLINEKK